MNFLTQRLIKADTGFQVVTFVRCPQHRMDRPPDDVIYEGKTVNNCQICDEEWWKEVSRITEAQTWLESIEPTDTVYLSGPMSNLPEHNRPAFRRMEHILKVNRKCSVLNPATHPEGRTYEWYMRKDLEWLLGASVVIMLRGWRTSRGSMLEHSIASILNLRINEEI